MTTASDSRHTPTRLPGWLRIALLVALLAGLGVAWALLPVDLYVIEILHAVGALGPWGPVVLAGFFVLACILMLPGSVITLAAGFAFGLLTGTVAVSVGSTLGATAAFLVGRKLARNWVSQKVAHRPKFAAIDQAVGREGFKIVLLTRLSPVFPFNLLNYAYGLTGVKLWKYVLASWIGMLPGTIAYVYLGTGLRSLSGASSSQASARPTAQVMFWAGLVVALGVMIITARIARRAIRRTVAPPPSESRPTQ